MQPPPDDDHARLAEARAGDVDARAWLAERWTAPVYRFAYRMMGNEQDAHDITQETLIKVLRHLDQYDPNRAFATWLFGIARNTCVDEHRRRRRVSWDEPEERELVDPTPSPLALADRAERSQKLTAALERLAPLYREVVVLYHFEHLKYVEIAEILDVPLGTVMNRIFRARRKLRDLYEAEGGTG